MLKIDLTKKFQKDFNKLAQENRLVAHLIRNIGNFNDQPENIKVLVLEKLGYKITIRKDNSNGN